LSHPLFLSLSHLLSLYFFFSSSVPLPLLLSFPTRRSSDLTKRFSTRGSEAVHFEPLTGFSGMGLTWIQCAPPLAISLSASSWARSEEHTSELQSRFDLVCRLLLEKKKKKTSEIEQKYKN